jgi:sarcosine oxidase
MAERYDVIVLGLGAMGAASAYQLAKRGARILGIDQYAPPHRLGSSHGESRITRIACAEGAHFTPFVRRSHEIWQELEAETGKSLLTRNGMLMIGPPGEHRESHGTNNFLTATIEAAEAWDIPHEKLDASQLRQRFPAFAIRDGDQGYHDTVSGFVRPEACIEAQLTLARKLGATLNLDEKAIEIGQDGRDAVVVTEKGTYRARQLIVAAGAYLPTLLGPHALNAHFKVTRQILFWFKARDDAAHRQFTPDRCPVFIWQLPGEMVFYGFPALGGLSEGVKIATEYDAPTTAYGADRTVSPQEIRHMVETFVKPAFPGLSDECVRTEVCLYTEVKGARFLIDRHPDHDRIIVASPCSGHGFKHSAALGELLSRMALGECGTLPEFRFDYRS